MFNSDANDTAEERNGMLGNKLLEGDEESSLNSNTTRYTCRAKTQSVYARRISPLVSIRQTRIAGDNIE